MTAVLRNSPSTGPKLSNSLSFSWSVEPVEPDVGELLRPLHVLEHREDTENVVLVDVRDHQDVDGPRAASVANPSPGGRTASALPH
jgi:hypothetical protein